MVPRQITLAAAALLVAAPLCAQTFDPSLGVEAVAVLEGGRLLVANAEASFDCALVVKTDAVLLSDCRPASGSDGAEELTALSDGQWQEMVRETLVAADCKLSAAAAVTDIATQAAEDRGATPEEIESLRTTLEEKADAAVDRMMKDGKLSVMDGQLVLYDCP
ncbi:hypothetical protein [Pseudooceanicola nanhaiensis]|uniref:hypothetical protein n=1 Tax=Pseudooceanicola nanhaiensis TaxID=375761 RepID=UPI0035143EBF